MRFQTYRNTVSVLLSIVQKLISKYPEAEFCLGFFSDIIVHPMFEQAVGKIRDGNEYTLKYSERKCVVALSWAN